MSPPPPVNKTVTYSTVTNIPGEPSKCWITSNLGADHQAASFDDNTEESAGWYWQFDRLQGYKHDGITRTPPTWNSSITLDEYHNWGDLADPCTQELGAAWRLPTITEWNNVDASGGWANVNDPYNSALKLHAAGCLSVENGSLGGRGSYGYYWSSSCYQVSQYWTGKSLHFYSNVCNTGDSHKAEGLSVRCLREN